MSTSVCQGMQTQFDPWLAEPRIIGFKLSQPASKISLSTKTSRNGDLGGWSFLQTLTNPTHISETVKEGDKDKEKEYIHPLVKKSASVLSEKSLEMCTESLGSETGSIISDSGDELISSSFVSEFEKSPRMSCVTMIKERSTSSSSFPPPISTFRSGCSGGFQVESQRQDGRLVIKAVSVGTSQGCFKAERTNGRLTLRFLDNSCGAEDECNRESSQGDEFYDGNDNNEGNANDDEYIVNDGQLYNEMEESSGNVVDEVESSNFSRRSRCNEEGAARMCKELQNWEPFLVASS
uniref:FAF domain-containing protein n=1 Tax=Chenopodium quinoa TaxID=63459 RepID=A0A803NAX0_CHEQI